MAERTLRRTPGTASDVVLHGGNAGLLARYAAERRLPPREARRRFGGLERCPFTRAAVPGTHAPPGGPAPMRRAFPTPTGDYRRLCHGHLGRLVDHRSLATSRRDACPATRLGAEDVFGRLDEGLRGRSTTRVVPTTTAAATPRSRRPASLTASASAPP
jgi:hypothetical protein